MGFSTVLVRRTVTIGSVLTTEQLKKLRTMILTRYHAFTLPWIN